MAIEHDVLKVKNKAFRNILIVSIIFPMIIWIPILFFVSKYHEKTIDSDIVMFNNYYKGYLDCDMDPKEAYMRAKKAVEYRRKYLDEKANK